MKINQMICKYFLRNLIDKHIKLHNKIINVRLHVHGINICNILPKLNKLRAHP